MFWVNTLCCINLETTKKLVFLFVQSMMSMSGLSVNDHILKILPHIGIK